MAHHLDDARVHVDPATAAATGTDCGALVHQRRQRDIPAVVDIAEAVIVGDSHLVEEHLVETRSAGHLAQRAHLDPGRTHVDDEASEPFVLGQVDVSTCDYLADVAVLRASRPHLLAGDHPLVAVALGLGLQTGEVAAGAWLAEQLTTDDVGAVHRAQVQILGDVAAVGEDRRRDHSETDRERVLVRDFVLRLESQVRALVAGWRAAVRRTRSVRRSSRSRHRTSWCATRTPCRRRQVPPRGPSLRTSRTRSLPSPHTNLRSASLRAALASRNAQRLALELFDRDLGLWPVAHVRNRSWRAEVRSERPAPVIVEAMARFLTVAAAQMGPVQREHTRAQVVQRLIAMLHEAHAMGAELVVYPELALTTFFPRWFVDDIAEADHWYERAMPNADTQPLFDEAKRLGVGFCLGLRLASTTTVGDGTCRRWSSATVASSPPTRRRTFLGTSTTNPIGPFNTPSATTSSPATRASASGARSAA